MKKSHDRLALRLSLILTKLNSGEKFTAIELAKEFDVSIRTIQRDIKDRLSYIPIEKNGNYYSMESHALGKLNFADIKNFATLSGIKSLYPSLSNEFITDILNSKLNKAYLIKNQGFEDISDKKELFEMLSAAVIKYSPINFIYSDKKREVNPYKLISVNGIWYLLAEEDNNLKTFTFSKIKSFKWENENKKFTPKKDILEKIENSKNNWLSKEEKEVTLQIDNKIKEYFLRQELLSNIKIVEENKEYFIVSTKVSFDDELLQLVKHWIPYIKIILPLNLQDKLNIVLKEYLSKFD